MGHTPPRFQLKTDPLPVVRLLFIPSTPVVRSNSWPFPVAKWLPSRSRRRRRQQPRQTRSVEFVIKSSTRMFGSVSGHYSQSYRLLSPIYSRAVHRPRPKLFPAVWWGVSETQRPERTKHRRFLNWRRSGNWQSKKTTSDARRLRETWPSTTMTWRKTAQREIQIASAFDEPRSRFPERSVTWVLNCYGYHAGGRWSVNLMGSVGFFSLFRVTRSYRTVPYRTVLYCTVHHVFIMPVEQ